MMLIAWYVQIKLAHVTLVVLSGALFALRGAGVLAGQAWPLHKPWRLASVAIDTLLLAAGVTMWTLLSLQPVRDAWLGSKLLLLLVYIVLGSFALKRASTWRGKALCYVASLAVFGHIVSTALAHHPLGLLWLWSHPV